MIHRFSLLLQSGFYILAGINHFRDPDFYEGLIPDYLPFSVELINTASGVIEILFGLGLLIPRLRKWASWGIILMLIAFIPSHVWFIQIGSCVPDGFCVSEWVAWVRLLVIHPLLIGWAWVHR